MSRDPTYKGRYAFPRGVPLWMALLLPLLGLMMASDLLGWPQWLVIAYFIVWTLVGITGLLVVASGQKS